MLIEEKDVGMVVGNRRSGQWRGWGVLWKSDEPLDQ